MNAPTNFQQFQRDFGLHLRDPRRASRPTGVPARRAGAYRELLFNNVCGIVDACFPVARELLGERRWSRLQRAFFAEWRSQSPLFCDLPREFLRWLNQTEIPVAMPAWMPELLHYEWAELAVDIMQTAPLPATDAGGDLLAGRPVVAPAHMALAYAWPVHRIGPEWKPRKPAATHLVVFRDRDERVQFAEINAVTARLLALLADVKATGPKNGREACLRIAAELGHPDPEAVVAGGATMLNDLKNWGVIHGIAV